MKHKKECPIRKYELLRKYGEPPYSVKNGKIVPDVCTCKKKK